MNKETKAPYAPMRDSERSGTALLIIDMINPFDFERGRECHDAALGIVEPILRLRGRARGLDLPIIYVNDNFGEWHSEKSRLVERATDAGSEVSRRMAPDENDYFVIKPQFSGFYATNLPVILPKLGVSRLILTGIATDICILFTAADAHMRDYALWVPEDCTIADSDDHKRYALRMMKKSMNADISSTRELALEAWLN